MSKDAEMRGAVLYAKLIHRLLTHGDAYEELVEYTGLSYHTVIRYIKALRLFKDNNGNRLVRIAWYEDDSVGRATRPAFKMEPGPDAKRPRITPAEAQRRYRANKKRRATDAVMHSMITSPSVSVGHCD